MVYNDYMDTVCKYQSNLVHSYLSYRRSLGDLLSSSSYQSEFSKLYASAADSVNPIPITTPFIDGAIISSDLMYDWLMKISMNFLGLTYANRLGFGLLDRLSRQYDSLILQSKDNLNKLLTAKNALLPVGVNVSQVIPMTYTDDSGVNSLTPRFVKAEERGTNVKVRSALSTMMFPLEVTCKAPRRLRNVAEPGTLTITPDSPYYAIDLRYYEFDADESFNYSLEVSRDGDALIYRASADGSRYSNWQTIPDHQVFSPIYNDLEEPVGIGFRIRSLYTNRPVMTDWFTTTAKFNIGVNLSPDYGLVTPVTFALKTPTVVNFLTFYNYGRAPFVIERIEGSLDNQAYYTISETRCVVSDCAKLLLTAKFPVKYIKIYLKQESYTVVYEAAPDPYATLNTLSNTYDDPSTKQLILASRYDYGLQLLSDAIFKKELRKLKLSINWDYADTVKFYKYEIKIGDILVNGSDLITTVVK